MQGLVIDSFAGGGGASTGIEMALGRPVDIAINHDQDAIRMHQANHPYTKHYCLVDIGMRMLTPRELFDAQGFPPSYIIDRDSAGNAYSKKAQVARVGNSVVPQLAEALVRANVVTESARRGRTEAEG